MPQQMSSLGNCTMTLHRHIHLQLMHKLHQSTAHTSLRAMPCNGKQMLRSLEARSLYLRMLCTSPASAFLSCADDEGMTDPSTVSPLRPALATATQQQTLGLAWSAMEMCRPGPSCIAIALR